jgi:hypothetical protein
MEVRRLMKSCAVLARCLAISYRTAAAAALTLAELGEEKNRSLRRARMRRAGYDEEARARIERVARKTTVGVYITACYWE